MNKTFGVIGGDRRQAELARLLAADGHTVRTYGLDRWKPGGETSLAQAASAGIVILPLPLCKGDGVLNCEEGPVPTTDLFRRLRPEQRILAGQVKPQQRREAVISRLTHLLVVDTLCAYIGAQTQPRSIELMDEVQRYLSELRE